MRPRHRLGLVVGKFAPLHLGHEWLIEQAAQRCERLLVLSYTNPEFDRCDSITRRHWFAQRLQPHDWHVIDNEWLAERCMQRGLAARPLPPNDAPDNVHQDYLAWLLHDVLRERPDALFASENYVTACASALSRALGQPVEPVLIDLERRRWPIRASVIRRHPTANLEWLSLEVAAAYTRRVLLLGGESSGKTTLAAALAEAYDTVWVPEYGRERWMAAGGRLDEADLLAIAHEQVAREARLAAQAHTWLFCDTSPLTTLGYSMWTHGRADPRLRSLAYRRYDAIVLCSPDFAFVQDGTRRDAGFRLVQDAWYRLQLRERGWSHLDAGGSIEQRVALVRRHLDDLAA